MFFEKILKENTLPEAQFPSGVPPLAVHSVLVKQVPSVFKVVDVDTPVH